MDYKALEDLVNILVRKSGLELKNNQKNKEKKELEEKLDTISSKVFLLEKSGDQLELEYLLKEKELILSSLEEEQENALTYAEDILTAFNSNKPYAYIKDKIEKLCEIANKEYGFTFSEINETNIFTEMEKYNKIINDHKDKISQKKYINNPKSNVVSFMQAYKSGKLKSLYRRKSYIPDQINAINQIVEKLKIIRENLNLNKAITMKKLNDAKNEFYPQLLKKYYKDNISEIKDIIKYLENEIEEMNKLSESYLIEIKKYEEEIIKKQKDQEDIEKEIYKEENNFIPSDINNNADYLKDKIEMLRSEDRLDSLMKEQQYLYVDVDVIKEEIELLWNKKNSSNSNNESNEGL